MAKWIKVTRTLVYEGPEQDVRRTLTRSYITPDNWFNLGFGQIYEASRVEEVMNAPIQHPVPNVTDDWDNYGSGEE